MNKKKIAKISAAVIGSIAIVVAGIVGVTAFIRHRNVATTGNLLGVEWYNETDPQFTITTVEQLYELAELSDFYSFKGQTIKLGADLVVNEGNAEDWAENSPSKRWNPITGFAGTFDGQNHTISGLYGKGFERRMALFADTQMSCSVKNLSLTNSYFETTGHRGTASIVSHGGGKFKKIYSDAIIVHKGENVGGIASTIDVQSTFEECWFDGDINITRRDCGGIIDEVLGARVTVKHCLFSGYIYSSYDVGGTRTGGIFGRTDKAATIVLNDSLSSGTIECEKKVYTGSMLGASYNGVQFTIEDTYVSMDTYGSAIGESGKKGTFTGTPLQMRKSELTGVKAYQWTTLNFDSYWAVVEDGTPILKCFAETVPSLEGIKKVYDTSWYIQGGFDFTLMTREQLYGFFIKSASTDYKDCKVKLGADIVVNEGDASKWAKEEPAMPWYPVATFAGQFDGQGHTISGLYTKSISGYIGLFGQATAPSIIQNINIKNSYFEKTGNSAAFMGSVVGDTYGIVQNIYSDAIIVSEGNQVGGIVGRLNDNDKTMSNMRIDEEDYSVMSNCWFDGSIKMLAGEEENTGACEAGGLVGRVVQGDAIIEHCLNTGTISSDVTGRALMVGGLVGYVVNAGQLQITDCLNVGEIKADYTICVGSVIGRANTPERIITVKDTYATKESYKVGISKNSLKATIKGDVISVDKSWIEGNKGYQFTTLDFDKYWTVVVGPDGTPILSQFASKKPSIKGLAKMVDTSWYKADKKEMVIDSVSDLYGLAMISNADNFEGKTIKLAADVVVNPVDASILAAWVDGTATPENGWMTIGSSAKPFAGTFDGQGHTISGVYSVSGEQYNGLFGATTPTSMIKNLSLKDSYFAFNGSNKTEEGKDAAAYMGSIVGDLRGDMDSVYSNAIVTSLANQVGGLVGRANGAKDTDGKLTTSTLNNCWFDGQVILTGETARYAGGIAGVAVQGTVEFKHCLNSGSVSNERLDGGQFLGGIVGTEWAENTIVNIDNCLNTGVITAKYNNCIGSIVGRIQKSGSKFTITDTYAMKGCCTKDGKTDVAVWSNHKEAAVKGKAVIIAKSELIGSEAYKWTNLNFDFKTGYWSIRANETPVLRSFNTTASEESVESVIVPDTSWYDKNAKTLYIESEAQLYGLTKLVNHGITFKNQTVCLKKDLDLNPTWKDGDETAPANKWLPIGNSDCTFEGTFDGQKHEIKGVYVSGDTTLLGLFGYVDGENAMIKNLRLTNSRVEHTGKTVFVGGVVGYLCKGTISGVYCSATVKSNGAEFGGIVGRAEGLVEECWFDGAVISDRTDAAYVKAAGIVGTSWSQTGTGKAFTPLTIKNCLNTGSVIYKVDTTSSSGAGLGGIFGGDRGYTVLTVEGCLNTGIIKTNQKNGTGSIVGNISQNTTIDSVKTYSTVNITNCFGAKNAITTRTDGRILGYNNQNCTVKMTISAAKNIEDIKGQEVYKNITQGSLDLDYDVWVGRKSDVPVPRCFVDTIVKESETVKAPADIVAADTNWYDADKTDLYIGEVEELYGLVKLVNNGTTFKNQTVHLTNEKPLDMNPGWDASGEKVPENEWIPIGNSDYKFQGIFDGQGHEIKGVYITGYTTCLGLFGYVDGAEAKVMNLRLTNSRVEHTGKTVFVGGVVGFLNQGTISGVYCKATVKSNGAEFGGIVGRAEGLVEKCWFDGEVIADRTDAAYVKAAGIVGTSWSQTGDDKPINPLTIRNCLNTGSVTYKVETTSNSGAGLGGIYGGDRGYTDLTVEDCVNTGVIETNQKNGTGSIVGNISKDTEINKVRKYSIATIKNCYGALDTITAHLDDKFDGRIFGYNNENCKITQIANATRDIEVMKGYAVYKKVTDDGLGLDYTVWVARKANVPVPRYFVDTVVAKSETVEMPSGLLSADTNWYDENATDLYIDNEEKLLGFAKLVNDGTTFRNQTVYLTKDLDLNPTWKDGSDEKPINEWIPIGQYSSALFDGTFNGEYNGKIHSISGIYCVSDKTDSSYVGLFGVTGSNSIIKNVILLNSHFEKIAGGGSNEVSAFMGSIVGDMRGALDTVYSKATVNSAYQQVGGLIGRANGTKDANGKYTTVDIKNCWFDGKVNLTGENGTYAAGIVGVAVQGTINIENCLNTGSVASTKQETGRMYVGGIIGTDWNPTTVNIVDCLNTGEVKADGAENYMGSVFGRINKAGSIYNIKNTYATEESFIKNIVDNNTGVVTVNGGKSQVGGGKDGTLNGTGILKAQPDIAGAEAYKNTLLDFYVNEHDKGSWVARIDKVPALKSFVSTIVTESSVASLTGVEQDGWYSDDIDTYYIGTVSAFKAFRDLVNNGTSFEEKTVFLSDNINLNPDWTAPKNATETVNGNPSQWTPIGKDTAFVGVFDGQGNAISGIYVNEATENAGLFAQTASGSVIQNISIVNSYIYSTVKNVGSVVGYTQGTTLKNIYSEACVIGANCSNIGGIVGQVQNGSTGEISCCWFNGSVSGKTLCGGIVGLYNYGTMTLRDCLVTGSVDATNGGATDSVGGLVGKVGASTGGKTNLTVSTSVSAARSVTGGKSGGVVGYRESSSSTKYSTLTLIDVYTTHAKGIGTQSGSANPGHVTDTTNIVSNINDIKGDVVYKDVSEGGLNLDYNVWVARTSDVPVPRCFVGTVVNQSEVAADTTGRIYVDISWLEDNAGTEADPYQLDSAGDLLGLAQLVNSGNTFLGKHIELTADIDYNPNWTVALDETTGKLSGKAPKNAWTPIGSSSIKFAGTFDGQGHTIRGLYSVSENTNADLNERIGLFGATQTGSLVKDVKLTNSYFYSDPAPRSDKTTESYAYMGSVIGELRGTLEKVYSDAIVISTGRRVGGLIGYINAYDDATKKDTTVNIKNSWFDGQVRLSGSNGTYGAGIVGFVNRGTVNIVNTLFSGEIVYKGTATNLNTGGILGSNNLAYNVNLINCLSTGRLNVEGTANTTGSIIGYLAKSGSVLTVQKTYATNECFTKGTTPTSYGNFASETTHTNITKTSNLVAENSIMGDSANSSNGIADLFTVAQFDGETEVKWTTLKVQENNQVKEMTPILKDFKAWWLDEHNYTKNVLMIGNSFSYYYVEELYGIAEAAGVHLNIYNVYYSGCSLEKHWNWLQNDEKNYEFYLTNADGRRRVISGKVGLKECLAVVDWDIISLQQASTTYIDTVDTAKALTEPYAQNLYGYLRNDFPNARYLWHQTWSSQIGYQHASDANNKVADRETQKLRDANADGLAKYICQTYNVENVPSGIAWDIARENVLIGDTLCNRVNDKGVDDTDYHHDGNVGGGQYLNACVWFETLTGKSCVGNTYRPADYDLSEEKIAVLQQSAHEAVKAIYGETE